MDLNIDQRRIIESIPNGHMAIKGVAGSGKTTVAIHKLPFLTGYYTQEQDDKILIVTYSKTLINYIDKIYKEMNAKEESIFSVLDENSKAKVEIKTMDSLIFKMYKRMTRKNPVFVRINEYKKFIIQAINEVKKNYTNVNILDNRYSSFFEDEIQWIKACRINELEVYQDIERKGRASTGSDGPQRLIRNSDSRKCVFEVKEILDLLMRKAGVTDFNTMAIEVCHGIENKKINLDKFTHILIDECQDLSRCQLEILKHLYNNKPCSSFLLIGDTSQSIYPKSWLAYNSYKSIGFDMTGRSKHLSKNYRTTSEIAKVAYALIEKDELITKNENYVKPICIDRHGDLPLYKRFENITEEYKFILQKILEISKTISPSEMAIVARTKNMLDNIKRYLLENGIDCEHISMLGNNLDEDKVNLLTLHSVKGLEFKVVIIMGIDEGIIPYMKNISTDEEIHISMERKLLYVGMTRAKNTLILTSSGEESRFMEGLEKRLFQIEEVKPFDKLYQIKIQDYRFKLKITSMYNDEEIIRQWAINELIEKHQYSEEQIDIEYKVNSYSKIGFVDIVVFKKNKEPFILVEVKNINGDLRDAYRQLLSYSSSTPSVEYLIVTNGRETKILNRRNDKFVLVDKLKSNDYELFNRYIYIDLVHSKKYKIQCPKEDKSEIILFDEAAAESVDIDSFYDLSVYGEIAAGSFIDVNENIIESKTIPSNLLEKNKEYFMLKVKGDSMIEADICDGDTVVVKKQNYCNQMDIIVAITPYEGCTIKRYLPVGDNVLLIPENKKYKPLEVKAQELYINGVVVGVIG